MTLTFIKNAYTDRAKIRHEERTYGAAEAACLPGRHRLLGVDNVYLDVRSPISASWVFWYGFDGKKPELGLGSAFGRDGTIAFIGEAKRMAAVFAGKLANGQNPKAHKRSTMTFAEALEAVIEREQKSRPTWGEAEVWARYGKIWFPGLMKLKPAQVDRHRVAEQLGARRGDAGTTADRARYVIWQVMEYCRSVEICAFDINPADKLLIDNILGSRVSTEQEEHAAVPYTEAPAFAVKCLSPKTSHWRLMGNARKALMVAASIPHRSAEVFQMRRADVDLATGRWNTPMEHNKKGNAQVNVLPWQVVEILRSLPVVEGNPYFFAGGTLAKPTATHISASRMREILQDEMQITGLSHGEVKPATVHGWRSSMVTHAGEARGIDKQTMKDLLSHRAQKKGKKAEAVDHYYRPENIAKRAEALQAWCDYLYPASFAQEVVTLKAA